MAWSHCVWHRAKTAKKEHKSNKDTPVTREYTINLHKRLHGVYVALFIDDLLVVVLECTEHVLISIY